MDGPAVIDEVPVIAKAAVLLRAPPVVRLTLPLALSPLSTMPSASLRLRSEATTDRLSKSLPAWLRVMAARVLPLLD